MFDGKVEVSGENKKVVWFDFETGARLELIIGYALSYS